MEKTINCAECGVIYKYDENPKFPRKYCVKCGDEKKEQWVTITNGDAKPEAEKPKEVEREEYEIGKRRCRSNALASAIEFWRERDPGHTSDDVKELARKWEKYIVTGE